MVPLFVQSQTYMENVMLVLKARERGRDLSVEDGPGRVNEELLLGLNGLVR